MPFSSYATLGQVARTFQIRFIQDKFVVPLPMTVSDHLREDLDFAQRRVGFYGSEFAVCENLIYPILKEVWKTSYLDDLQIWSHQPLYYDEDLSGTPDYMVARQSPLGNVVMEEPYLLVVEAKKDDFERGWGQCLAAMLASQKINHLSRQILYGIATNGRSWEFGKLQDNQFTQDPRGYGLADLDQLCAVINFLFEQCRQQVRALALAEK